MNWVGAWKELRNKHGVNKVIGITVLSSIKTTMKKEFITTTVSNLIAAYRKNGLSELDLYNSILQLVYLSDKETKESLKDIILFIKEAATLPTSERTQKYAKALSEKEFGKGYEDGLGIILESLANDTSDSKINEQTEISIQDKIAKQYQSRINYIGASNKSEEQKKAEIEKLFINCTFDPRRPEVSYTSRSQAEKSLKVQEILDSLSDEEFLTDSYVLNWHDLLNS